MTTQPPEVQRLKEVGILSEEDLADFSFDEIPANENTWIDELLSGERLTPFQASRIKEGRTDELALGNYLILNELGAGGMGVVYKALHRRMDRVVAIKLIKSALGVDDQFLSRFHSEVRAAARLNHPNAIAAYDADDSESGPYLVMEYVEGSDLSQIVKQAGPLSLEEGLEAMRQAALGIGYAHSQGVVHRDIKPANLMRDIHGTIKIADLGLAQLVTRGSTEHTEMKPGTVSGSVAYMSPEQTYDTNSVDHRGDIYSLGCTLFHVLTGRPVFLESNPIECMLAQRERPAPSLSDHCEDAPQEVDAIFQKMVTKDRDQRYQSMEDVIRDIEAFTGNRPKREVKSWNPEKSTVCLVESSSTLTKVVRRMLSQLGCDDVHPFESGAAVLESVGKLPTEVVLTSMELPDMTGIELARRIREDFSWTRILVVIMTATMSEAQKTTVRRMPGVELIKKPFKPDGLEQTITRLQQSDSIADSPLANVADLKVLIVDDSSVARRHEQRVLSDLGFTEFRHADDGPPALEALQEQSFDLIVVDYNMPLMNGQELVKKIREDHGDVPIVMCTSEYDPMKLGQIYALGVSAICSKSFEPELVRNVIVRLFK